jgi:PEP-CTERM motif
MLWRNAIVTITGVAFALLFGVADAARADVIAWDEAVNGEFSHDGLAPTQVKFISGGNDILGTYGKPNAATDPVNPDYFTFTVPAGSALTGIIVLPGTTAAGPLGISFIGIEQGNQVTLGPSPPDATGLLGWHHTDPAMDIGTDILGKIGNPMPPMGETGFMPPLGPGDYAVWLQETGVCGPSLCNYGFDFTLAAIPEPASLVLLGSALLGLGLICRRKPAARLLGTR